jgi:hypothetical protein
MIVAKMERELRIVMDPTGIDPDATYQFRIEQDGRVYMWSGAKAVIEDGQALFDYQNGLNGILIAGALAPNPLQ